MIECQKKTLLYIGIHTYYEWMNECIYKIIDDMIYESSLKLNEISNKHVMIIIMWWKLDNTKKIKCFIFPLKQ